MPNSASSAPFPFPTQPLASTLLPPTPLVRTAYTYIHTHTSPTVANHTIRSAFFALIILKKMPSPLSTTVDPETLVLATLLHDLGWSKDHGLVSEDKRFEVDGANAARDLVKNHRQLDDVGENVNRWDEGHLQRLWYAIALHTTPSIAMHAEPLTIMTGMGIQADFVGPNLASQIPGVKQQLITPDEFTEIIRAYPRLGFKEELREIMCGLCRRKPEVTFDNFVAEYGRAFVEGYEEKWEDASVRKGLEKAMNATVQFE